LRAVIYDGTVQFDPGRQRPEPGRDEILVRVTAAGICNTDLEIIRGYSGFSGILGHEFCGVVESSGPLRKKRVVGEINIGCQKCRLCLNGLEKHCRKRSVLGIINKDGAMADYLTLPARNLHMIPDSVQDDEAVFIEPLAAAMQVTNQLRNAGDAQILVMGDGKLGILSAIALKQDFKNVTLSGKHAHKLDIAKAFDIHAIHKDDLIQNSPFYDIIVEATGSQDGLHEALRLVRPTGTVVLKTTIAGESRLDLASIVVKEIKIVGSRCGPFPQAIKMLAEKRINLKPLITASYPIEKALQAFEHAASKESLKILLTF